MSNQGSVQDAVALIKAGKRDDARAILTGILKDDKDNLAAWAGMVQVAKNKEEAAACLKQVLRLKPGDPWAARQLEKLEPVQPAPTPPSPPPPPSPLDITTPSPRPVRQAPPPPEPVSSDFLASTPSRAQTPVADSGGWTEASAPNVSAGASDETVRLEPEPLRRVPRPADEPPPTLAAEQPARGRSNTLLYAGIAVLVLAICVVIAGAVWIATGGIPSINAVLPGGGVGGTVYDGGDGYNTTLVQTIGLGQTQQSRLDDIFNAHNWQFEGTAGQSVTIRVNALENSDPQARLIDPRGEVIAQDDDGGGGYNALIMTTLPSDGTYTVRIDMWEVGPYSISVE